MSRINYNESDDPLAYGRWAGREKAVLKGKPGQAALRELEQVLLAMPDKRLTAGTLCDSDGLMCAMGAWMFARRTAEGVDPPAAKAAIRYISVRADPDDDNSTLIAVASLAITETLGWLVVDANDEWAPPEPDRRHAYMLRWVRDRIKGG